MIKNTKLKVKVIYSQFTQRIGQLYQQGQSVEEIAKDRQLDALAQQFEKYPLYGE